ncbi:MAG: trehalose-6-phosphate synthase [Verrucomicrobium sp.]|nr:trehalose-6-phosphate synthase [Verrucomicrobium sp.]
MRLSLRFILPLILVLAAIAYALIPVVDHFSAKWFGRDLNARSELIFNSLEDTISSLVETKDAARIQMLFSRMVRDERLYAAGVCDPAGRLLYKTESFPRDLPPADLLSPVPHRVVLTSGPLYVSSRALQGNEGQALGRLLLVHDMSFIQHRSDDTKKGIFYLFVGIGLIVSLTTVLVAQLSWKGWISGMQALMRGEGLLRPVSQIRSPELQPIAKELRALVKELEVSRHVRDENQINWSPLALKEILHKELAGEEILTVSNREPYIHRHGKDGQIIVQVPASGLVTALEPVMRACSGTWIAHGSGDADRETVDARDHVRVPPEDPFYSIRRIWLSKEEEQGYYYGFANEGLWPLCHIAHTRPIFRSSDWQQYVRVNERFADAVVEEARTENPVILVQDYHFALLPEMVRRRLPRATIITFWHIPWPNAESFGICPWREEILRGLLGSSILGFHTRYHCNNFLDSVDRLLESRIDREHSTVTLGGQLCAVNRYPISIEWPPRWETAGRSVRECRRHIRKMNGMEEERLLGIGVERLDYTKGIQERFLAVERLLELQPEWIGRFSFIQIAAPSRTTIGQYQALDQEVRQLAERINARFGRPGYDPIVLKVEHHDAHSVFEHFRAAELCFVSSLHDGMNLVAKEFVAARNDDEQGVLILSQFTGAARELSEALIVNPYDIDQCAAALHLALTMPPLEQRDRMQNMAALVKEFNVYRWAGKMLIDAARMRQRGKIRTAGGEAAA